MKNPSEENKDKDEAIALFRYGLIADIVRLKPGTPGIYKRLREIAAQRYIIPGSSRTRVAPETLRGWVSLYRAHGFDGLHPRRRGDRGKARKLDTITVDALLELKESTPKLTVKQVIATARATGVVSEEIPLPPSTVHRLLERAGLMEKSPGGSQDRRRFSYSHAGELWMSDVMHGPAVLVDGSRRKKKTYLIAFIDDATRVITHGQFCFAENAVSFLPVFKTAILRRGIPQRLYVDNGAAYRCRQLELICARLSVALIHARPYQPQGKGKIERFFRTVRAGFLGQATLESLETLNQQFWAWVEGEYHQSPHRGLDGQIPIDRWAMAAGRIQTVGPNTDLDALFLWEQKRRVRHDRTVSLNGTLYEVVAELIGSNVTVRYDPAAPPQRPIEVWHKGKRYPDATVLDAYANCYVKRERPSLTARTDTAAPQPNNNLDFTKLDPGDK